MRRVFTSIILSLAAFSVLSCGSDAHHGSVTATASVANITKYSSTPSDSFLAAAPVKADVYVTGTVAGVSQDEIDVRGIESAVPVIPIRVVDTNGAFFRQTTRPALGLSEDEAAPQIGERVCVLARLSSSGDLVAWLIFLESDCQHNP
jgi:hypothetical protein